MEARRDDKRYHPDSFSIAAATGFRLDSVSIFFETSSTDLGNLSTITLGINIKNHIIRQNVTPHFIIGPWILNKKTRRGKKTIGK